MYTIDEKTVNDLKNRFVHHPPKEGQAERYAQIREILRLNAEYIVERTPVCREQSLALTKLEEAMMWANAAIARNE